MRQSTAKALTVLFVRQTAEQLELLKIYENNSASGDFQEVKGIIAKTMGAIYLDALQPIFKDYPLLKPGNFP